MVCVTEVFQCLDLIKVEGGCVDTIVNIGTCKNETRERCLGQPNSACDVKNAATANSELARGSVL